jgi:Flp pilus assembly protein TadG
MWVTDLPKGAPRRPKIHQRGTAAVEFALLAVIFFTLVFGILELARMMFVYNTLQEVTRRAAAAAAHVYPTDTSAIAALKQDAVFRKSPGELVLAPPVTDQHIRLSYLKYDLSVIQESSWPSDAAKNRQICTGNPHAANCIRFVQAQVCDPATTGNCSRVTSKTVVPLIGWNLSLHKATTITPAGLLGYVPGTPPCGC